MPSWCVHARDEDLARPHRVEAADPLHAALEYAERWLGAAGEEAVTVLVEDEETGAEHCLTLDLGSGEARACGQGGGCFRPVADIARRGLGADDGACPRQNPQRSRCHQRL